MDRVPLEVEYYGWYCEKHGSFNYSYFDKRDAIIDSIKSHVIPASINMEFGPCLIVLVKQTIVMEDRTHD